VSAVRERIIAAAYPLFVTRGIRDVTTEDVLARAGVTLAEYSNEFASRDALATECLSHREREWTLGMVEAGARARGATPELQLLAIFEVFHDWFQRDDYEACTFINVLLEMGREHPLGQASILHLLHIRDIVATLATEAELADPDDFALSWHILMKGSIVNAVEGDRDAALRARAMAADLIKRHKPAAAQIGDSEADWMFAYEYGTDGAGEPTREVGRVSGSDGGYLGWDETI
jgi:AcrR family transcriptional regulator